MASFCHKPRLTESRVQDPYNLRPPNPKGGRTAWGRGEQRHLPMKLGNFWTPFNIWLRRRQPSRTNGAAASLCSAVETHSEEEGRKTESKDRWTKLDGQLGKLQKPRREINIFENTFSSLARRKQWKKKPKTNARLVFGFFRMAMN